MKLYLLFTTMTVFAASQTKVWCKPACDQQAYDNAYRIIIDRTISSKMTQEDLDHRNDTIEALRTLCKGQVSTWEKGKSWNN